MAKEKSDRSNALVALETATNDIFDSFSDYVGLRGLVRTTRQYGVALDDFYNKVVLESLDTKVQGGAYVGAQPMGPNAWALYQSLDITERKQVKGHYSRLLRQAQRDPATKGIFTEGTHN